MLSVRGKTHKEVHYVTQTFFLARRISFILLHHIIARRSGGSCGNLHLRQPVESGVPWTPTLVLRFIATTGGVRQMDFHIFAGIFSALAIIFLLLKFDIKKVLYFDIAIDLASSFFLIAVFFGSFAGMMAAVIGGALISATLWILKRTIGYRKPTWNRFWYSWEDAHVKHQHRR